MKTTRTGFIDSNRPTYQNPLFADESTSAEKATVHKL